VEDVTETQPGRDRFQRIFQANYASLIGYALRRTASVEDAADAVAESFLAAWRRLDEVPDDDEARLWLYGIIRRVMANQRRTERRRTNLAERLGVELAGLRVLADNHEASDLDAIARGFQRLSDAERDLLGMVTWEGLGTLELAKVLGCTKGAARVRLHRARRRLAQELAWEEQSAGPQLSGTSTRGMTAAHKEGEARA
jgi:RNA polymerase sigma-70 factor (ECF subfamily)